MMKANRPFWGVFALFFLSFSLFLTQTGCKRNLTARKMSPSMAAYIYAYTSGIISKEAPVRVRFTAPLVAADKVGKAVDGGIFSLTPSVSGDAVWEDAQTIRFTPKTSLDAKTAYLGTVKIKRLFPNVAADAETFEFDFRTPNLGYYVDVQGIEAENSNNPAVQNIVGEVTTTDVVEEKALEKVLSATQQGEALPIAWSHNGEGTKHQFRVKSVKRDDSEQTVQLSWSGKAIDVSEGSSENVVIPALGDFKLMSSKVMQEDEQYIRLSFSDAINPNQDLNGLINIQNPIDPYAYNNPNDTNKVNNFISVRTVVDKNTIRVYPSDRLVGQKDLKMAASIRNDANKNLDAPINEKITFTNAQPAVRLVGRGVIVPNDAQGGLQFPFEAINVSYVDVEIVKIYSNNMLDYLKTNEIAGSGTYNMENFGKVILQKTVALKDLNSGASSRMWARYALDLGKMVKTDPQAMYQVRIGFKKEYATFACDGKPNADALNGMVKLNEADVDDDKFKSVTDYTYYEGVANYDEDYNYNDPCRFSGEHYIVRNVVPSDLGLIAKRGGDGSVYCVVSDLKTTEPSKGVKLEIFDKQSQSLGTVTTNSDGTARFDALKGKPFAVIATASNNQRGYLKLEDNDALNLSRFQVEGQAAIKGMKGFVYGERGVWRPGDSLFLNFMLEDKDGKLPAGFPVTLEFFDPKGALQYRTVSLNPIKNIYPFHFNTRPDAPTGNWRADVKVGGAVFSQNIKIEAVKPNRLKINLNLGGKEIQADQANINAPMQVNWLHGAVARGLRTTIDAQMYSIPTVFKNYKGWAFDCPVRTYKTNSQSVYDNRVSDNGSANVAFNLPKAMNAPGKMRIGFKIRAYEQGGDFSTDYQSVDYSPYSAYVGMDIPKNKYGEKRFDIGKEGKTKVVCVDSKGQPLSNRSLKATVYAMEWKWWWETNPETDAYDFSQAQGMKSMATMDVKTNAKGEAEVKFTPEKWGRYLIYVSDAVSGHATGDFAYSGYPWDDSDYYAGSDNSRNNAAMLSFSSNKEKYAVGETIELNIPTSETGKVLISVENGSKVISSAWVNVKAGGVTKYTMKATPEMSPTAYAFVTVVQPHNQVKNDLPIRMYGVTPIDVEDPKTVLTPIVKMDTILRPEQTVTVEVSEKSGKAMAYTLALVDDGLLDITRFQTPDPHGHFYAREALGVKTFDVYDQVLGNYSGQMERLLNIGGDGANKPKNALKANRFKPAVVNIGTFATSGGTTKHTFKMPNYIGSVRAMVVASDGKGAYGNAAKNAFVRKPLMVLATLPRVLGVGEKLKIPVDIFAMEQKVLGKPINVTIEEKSGLLNFTSKNQSVTINRIGDENLNFEAQVGEKLGISKIKVTATGGGETSTHEIEIDVRNPNPIITNVAQGIVSAGQIWEQAFAAVGTIGTNKAILEVSALPAIDFSKRLQYLLAYPHGCVEQTTSAAFPQLYADKVTNLTEAQKQLAATNIKSAIDKLRQYQTASGGFGYWQGDEQGDSWATSYVGHFLIEAKNAGYTLPPSMLERFIKHQQTAAKKWTSSSTENGADLQQAYRLYTLALAKSPENGSMNALRESKNLSVQARWRLAAAFAVAGKKEVATQLLNGASTAIAPYRELSNTYGSELRDQAMILETLTLLGDKTKAFAVLQDVSKGLSSGDWYATQSVAYGLLAVSKFVGNEKASDKFTFSYTVNGKTQTVTSNTPIYSVEVPVGAANKVSIKNAGKGQLYTRLVNSGQPAVGDKTVAASNLRMSVSYKDMKGQPLNVANIRQGTDFIAEVNVTNSGTLGKTYKEMALTQIFPSGWEIHNTRMEKVQGFSNVSKSDYTDVRDDRVLTYFDVPAGKTQTYRVKLNAAYTGRYYLPSVSCEAMYDNSINARQAGQWVEVSNGGEVAKMPTPTNTTPSR